MKSHLVVVVIVVIVVALLPQGDEAAALRGPEKAYYPLMEHVGLPPALVIEPEGTDIEEGPNRRIFIPLPCTSIKCRSIIYKLAKMGKIPWEYYTQTLLDASMDDGMWRGDTN